MTQLPDRQGEWRIVLALLLALLPYRLAAATLTPYSLPTLPVLELCLAYPVMLYGWRHERLRILHCIGGVAILGLVVPNYIMFVQPMHPEDTITLPQYFALAATAGGLGGGLFWFLAMWNNQASHVKNRQTPPGIFLALNTASCWGAFLYLTAIPILSCFSRVTQHLFRPEISSALSWCRTGNLEYYAGLKLFLKPLIFDIVGGCSLIAVLCAAWPMYLLFKWQNWRRWWQAACGGMVAGVLCGTLTVGTVVIFDLFFVALGATRRFKGIQEAFALSTMTLAWVGLIAGLIFWLMVKFSWQQDSDLKINVKN